MMTIVSVVFTTALPCREARAAWPEKAGRRRLGGDQISEDPA
jgi:hypothetical protein